MRRNNTYSRRPARPVRARRALAAALSLAACGASSRSLAAQSVLGPGPSAYVQPAGVVRVSVIQSWSYYDARFGGLGTSSSDRVQLGAFLSSDALGVAQLPALASAEAAIRTVANQPAFALSLGGQTVTTSADVRTTTLDLEAGLGRRLSFAVALPIVRAATTVGVDVNPAGANVGINPAFAGNAAALAQNDALFASLDNAATRLRASRPECFAGTPTGDCAAVASLYASSTAYTTALRALYGGSAGTARTGTVVAPLAGSPAQLAVLARLATFDAAYRARLGATGAIAGSPAAALPIVSTDAEAIPFLPAFGIEGDSLRNVSRWALGDLTVGARFAFLDTFDGDEVRRLAPSGVNLRSTVGAGFRFGTGHVDSPDDPTDVGTGTGARAVELASYTDVLVGSRAWISVVGRYGRQLADQVAARIPLAGSIALPSAAAREIVSRDLGDYASIELLPRVALGSALALEGRYRYYRKSDDRYTGAFSLGDSASAPALDASVLGLNSAQTGQIAGGSITFSTLAAYRRSRARLPLDVSITYLIATSGSGGYPATHAAEVALRAYPKLLGGR